MTQSDITKLVKRVCSPDDVIQSAWMSCEESTRACTVLLAGREVGDTCLSDSACTTGMLAYNLSYFPMLTEPFITSFMFISPPLRAF